MPTFNDHLLEIHQQISIRDEDRKPYTEMFDTVRNWLMNEMRAADPVFDQMFKGTDLFGSYPNRVRIIKPSEFDIFILLKFPFDIGFTFDSCRPGFIQILNGQNNPSFCDHSSKNKISRLKLQNWISGLIEDVLKSRRSPNGYTISYKLCNVAHQIKVVEKGKFPKNISIDFVPAIILPEGSLDNFLRNYKQEYLKHFVAIPKDSQIPMPEISSVLTFQLVNPAAERDMMWNKQNLKVVYRLLKAFRDKYELHGIKSHFITIALLWQVNNSNDKFWHQPIDFLLLYMLNNLLGYFRSGKLPNFWEPKSNLLSTLTTEKMSVYLSRLNIAYNTLKELSARQYVSYTDVVSHFKTSA